MKKLIFLTLALFMGCSDLTKSNNTTGEASGLRPLKNDEKAADFDLLVNSFREYYGPLEYKEKRFSFSFEQLAAEYKKKVLATQNDLDAFAVMSEFVTRFQDGHVNLVSPLVAHLYYTVPLFISPIENKAIITKIADPSLESDLGISKGDEVLEVDGKAPFDYLPTLRKYQSLGNPLSDRHLIHRIFARPYFISELKPQKPHVDVKIQKADGSVIKRSLVWSETDSTIYVDKKYVTGEVMHEYFSAHTAEIISSSLNEMGAEVPFFMSESIERRFKTAQVRPSARTLKKYGFADPDSAPDLYAILYKYSGKNLLLLRQSGYLVTDVGARISWYKALLEEYGPLADALIIDQTHNPGGYLNYADQFISLFSSQKSRGLVNFLNGDRRWLETMGSSLRSLKQNPNGRQEQIRTAELGFKLIEDAYDQGGGLTRYPVALDGRSNYVSPTPLFQGKPILMLVDELAGSCGDIVPMIMKENKLAVLFGQRTMGLGGNVEEVMRLPHSRTQVILTRGLFTIYSPEGVYDPKQFIENNGVTPDILYSPSVNDYRNGYVEYFNAFSNAAATLVARNN